MNEVRSCPICLHDKSELLYTQKFAEHFEHKIVLCNFCGFVYVNNTPSQKYYNEYYKNQSKYEGTRQHEMHDEFTYKQFDYILRKFIPKNSSILEVGCSVGKLLDFIKHRGYKNLLGVEPAPECRIIAKKDYNISVITSTLEKFASKRKYDLVIFSAVLEHLTEVRNAIIKAYSLLNTNGMIYICVPDAERFHKKFDEPYGEFSTEHINFFTEKSLYQLMSNCDKVFIKSDGKAIVSLWKKIKIEDNGMHKYISQSQKKMGLILKKIELLPKNTIIWGVGALTQRLLMTTKIRNKIFKFVDSNKNLIGKKLDGIDILSPDKLVEYNNPILISSFAFKDEIAKETRKRELKNKIVTF
ncbi:class I SAM-dependent methyltransferase [Candidatus Gracilibacteria bacterium]|nr:class I SAM-dependent methyltransferase [Candidatus Gracilibacteria bacterium]